MRYVITRYAEYQKEMAYRFFVTDALYRDADNMRIIPNRRYYDMVTNVQESTESAEQIASRVIEEAGLVVSE